MKDQKQFNRDITTRLTSKIKFKVTEGKQELVSCYNRARQLYKNISMLFLFPVEDGNATFNASCYG